MEQYLKEYKGKNILITGGVGSKLTKVLINAEGAKAYKHLCPVW